MELQAIMLPVCLIMLSVWICPLNSTLVRGKDDTIQKSKLINLTATARHHVPYPGSHIKIPFWKRRFVGIGLVRPQNTNLSPKQKILYRYLSGLYRNRKRTNRKYGAEAWCQTQECIDHMLSLDPSYPDAVGSFGRR
ncbi:uncharacterized protein LOC117322160 [Pecten maximus]|uniref:uncharacterized protein LOC117322160 n=1 Tax=Pecten maximus TaxID=6579 RepID=UPI0014586241|nr:uncharacterized protein LOC117322160 [Pecten maximus]